MVLLRYVSLEFNLYRFKNMSQSTPIWQILERKKPIGFYPLPLPDQNSQQLSNRLHEPPDSIKQSDNNLLYLHIPFCKQRCPFCFFYTNAFRENTWRNYYELLKNHITKFARTPRIRSMTFAAMFIGGGSPNVLSASELSEITSSIFSNFRTTNDFELTLEWYPGDTDLEKLKTAKSSGVTRVSFGSQTFDPHVASLLGQKHTPADSRKLIDAALHLGFESLNVDLMLALPGQSFESFEADTRELANLKVPGITVNPLEVIPGTPLSAHRRAEQLEDEHKIRFSLIRDAYELLYSLGYKQQRFFNFYRDEKIHRYNRLSAAPHTSIVGMGSGSYGVVDNFAYVLDSNLNSFCQRIAQEDFPTISSVAISDEEAKRAYLVTSILELRILENEFRDTFGEPIQKQFGSILKKLVDHGLLCRTDEGWQLSREGALWGDNVASEFFSEQQNALLEQRFSPSAPQVKGHHYAPTALPQTHT